jgi:hypothetical protein
LFPAASVERLAHPCVGFFPWFDGDETMVTFNEMKMQEIMQDDGLSANEKVIQLREIETEVRGLQRMASESPMNAADGWDDDLRQVRLALDRLGADNVRKGAASL